MTEISEKRKKWSWPSLSDYQVDLSAFIFALVAAPLAPLAPIGVLLCLSFIPTVFMLGVIAIVAVFFGGIPYLTFGSPLLLLALLAGWRNWFVIGLIAVFANALFCLSLVGRSERIDLFVKVGTIFAFIWGASFAVLYKAVERPEFNRSKGASA